MAEPPASETDHGVPSGGMPRRFTLSQHNMKVIPLSLFVHALLLGLMGHFLGFDTTAKRTFLYLFFFRYTKLIVNTISWRFAKSWPVSSNTPSLSEITVIIPSTDVTRPAVQRCIISALNSGAAKVIISTFDSPEIQNLAFAAEFRSHLSPADQGRLQIVDSKWGNKRVQTVCALRHVITPYMVSTDDHCFWPAGPRYLKAILAPFEDPSIAVVGTNKRVVREQHTFWQPNLVNLAGCLYLDRHNMETVSTNRIDGGVWVISGRTWACRTEILKSPKFEHDFLNEYCLFGLIGPLNADDDLFVSRWMASQGHKMFFQIGEDALMYCTIDVSYANFLDKLNRWFRGPWGRSNPKSALEISRLWKYPWTYYAVHISGFINLAAIWDPLLLYKLYCAIDEHSALSTRTALILMGGWIVCSKLVKLIPHFVRNPGDFPFFFVAYLPFAYFMSAIKAWGMVTFWDTNWGSRKNVHNAAPKKLQ